MNVRLAFVISLVAAISASAQSNLEPAGKIHIPIGKPNTVDALKTFVEAEGNYSPDRDMILVDGQPVLVCGQPADNVGVLAVDQIGQAALQEQMPAGQKAESSSGDCSGAFQFRVTLDPGQEKSLQFVSPVHPGRKVNGHRWDGTSTWAQLDLNLPYSEDGQQLQPAPNLDFYRNRAHQGLWAGNRSAGWETLRIHLEHPQMGRAGQASGWFAFDEGGLSGIGNWNRLRSRLEIKPFFGTTLGTMAMPHGWAIAEFHLLLRDCLAYEDNHQLVLFAGIPENWFDRPMIVHGLPTHFGRFNMDYSPGTKSLRVTIEEPPADGILVRFPAPFTKKITVDGVECRPAADGSVRLDPRKQIELRF